PGGGCRRGRASARRCRCRPWRCGPGSPRRSTPRGACSSIGRGERRGQTIAAKPAAQSRYGMREMKTITIGVIGAGLLGRKHLAKLAGRDDYDLVGIADVNADKVAGEYPATRVFAD